MLIWSGWGVAVPFFMAIGLLITFAAADMLEVWLGYGPGGALGFALGGVATALGIQLIVLWRESRRRAAEPAGEAGTARRGAGSFFFVPTHFWRWIVLILFFAVAVLQYGATPVQA